MVERGVNLPEAESFEAPSVGGLEGPSVPVEQAVEQANTVAAPNEQAPTEPMEAQSTQTPLPNIAEIASGRQKAEPELLQAALERQFTNESSDAA